jgi:hypothetical protein
VAGAVAVAAALAGCGGSAPGIDAGETGAQVVPESRRWRDVDSAVSSATAENGVAVVSVSSPAGDERVYALTTMAGEPGELRARVREGKAGPTGGAWLVAVRDVDFACRIGRFGDGEREAAFVRDVRAWRPMHAR